MDYCKEWNCNSLKATTMTDVFTETLDRFAFFKGSKTHSNLPCFFHSFHPTGSSDVSGGRGSWTIQKSNPACLGTHFWLVSTREIANTDIHHVINEPPVRETNNDVQKQSVTRPNERRKCFNCCGR